MDAVSEKVTVKIGDAEITMSAEAAVRAWIDKIALAPTVGLAALPGRWRSSAPGIGEQWDGEGGVYAGIMRGEKGAPDYHLIVPTGAVANIEEITWGGVGTEESGALSEFDGLSNTRALISSSTDHPAAQWAAGLTIGEHSDFYLPARRELNLLYANVPELFEKVWHWSSTQFAGNSITAWVQYFGDGHQSLTHKTSELRARAVRRLVF
jgi:hypothetical protein